MCGVCLMSGWRSFLSDKAPTTPGFAYSWLELISHRTFIAKLLLHTPQQKVSIFPWDLEVFIEKGQEGDQIIPIPILLFHCLQGWPLFHQLLVDLFKFLSPFLRNAELTKPTQLLYKVLYL